MDSLLVLILVFVASCVTIFLLLTGLGACIEWILSKYHIGRAQSVNNNNIASQPSSSGPHHISIPILEAHAHRPKEAAEIESTCLVILPHENGRHSSMTTDGASGSGSGVVTTNYAIGMKSARQ
jgi:hypothetical protein